MSKPHYQYKDKFSISGASFDVEILGVFPAGQQRIVQLRTNSYKILLNGVEMDISEENLNMLKNAAQILVADEKVDPIVGLTNNDEEVSRETPRRGRPPKAK